MKSKNLKDLLITNCAVLIPFERNGAPADAFDAMFHVVLAGPKMTMKCGTSTNETRSPIAGPRDPGQPVDITFVASDYAALGQGPATVNNQPYHLYYSGGLTIQGPRIALPTQLGPARITHPVTFSGELQAYSQPPVPVPIPPLFRMKFAPNSQGHMLMYLVEEIIGGKFRIQRLYYLL